MKRSWPSAQTAMPTLARLLAGLLLGLVLLSGSHKLHLALHADHPASDAVCVICLLAHGQIEATESESSRARPTDALAVARPVHVEFLPHFVGWRAAPTRGPPATLALPSDS